LRCRSPHSPPRPRRRRSERRWPAGVLWSGEGTNTGAGNGLPATGKKLRGRGITIWRIADGKIREEWSELDQLRIMQQLGLLSPPAQ
jgi:ketosteroid isomerase-like protein